MNLTNSPIDNRTASASSAPAWLIFCAVAIGTSLAFPVANEQRSLDASLVLSGIVPYPSSQIMSQSYHGAWTLINQLSALALALGVPQEIVGHVPSAIGVGFLTGAYVMLLYGFSGRTVFSLLAALFCICIGPTTQYFRSTDYGAYGATGVLQGIIGGSRVFGLVGLALSVWSIAALAAGRNVLAGASAIMLISIHPVIGAYTTGLLTALVIVGRAFTPPLPIEGILRGFLLGGIVTLPSFAVYRLMRAPPGLVDADAYNTYMKFWDAHRNQIVTSYDAWRIALTVLGFAAVLTTMLVVFRKRRTPREVAAAALLMTVVGSGTLYFFAHALPSVLPEILIQSIPGRFISVHAILSNPFLFAFAAWLSIELHGWYCGLLTLYRASEKSTIGQGLWLSAMDRLRRPQVVDVALYLSLLMSAWLLRNPIKLYLPEYARQVRLIADERSRENGVDDPFWTAVRHADIRGPVLASQEAAVAALRYGHLAVAFDVTSFDFVPYFPHLAAETARFVEKGYGVSFSNPPPGIRFHGSLPPGSGRAYWASLTPKQWRQIGQDLGVIALVIPATWQVELPVIVTGSTFSIFRIPAQLD